MSKITPATTFLSISRITSANTLLSMSRITSVSTFLSMYRITSVSIFLLKLSHGILLQDDFLKFASEVADTQKATFSSTLSEDLLRLNPTANSQQISNVTQFCHQILRGATIKSISQLT